LIEATKYLLQINSKRVFGKTWRYDKIRQLSVDEKRTNVEKWALNWSNALSLLRMKGHMYFAPCAE